MTYCTNPNCRSPGLHEHYVVETANGAFTATRFNTNTDRGETDMEPTYDYDVMYDNGDYVIVRRRTDQENTVWVPFMKMIAEYPLTAKSEDAKKVVVALREAEARR